MSLDKIFGLYTVSFLAVTILIGLVAIGIIVGGLFWKNATRLGAQAGHVPEVARDQDTALAVERRLRGAGRRRARREARRSQVPGRGSRRRLRRQHAAERHEGRVQRKIVPAIVEIRREDQRIIFEMFRQVDASSTRRFGCWPRSRSPG